ncbi:hypothetical protein BUALT_Bualt07G0131700 [Buddleja alternifolia]|uniref:4-coumarate--CoA ligase n=1 Tax=Buddleja alternifolia TaxID=168488 RepID=A0AAV6XAE4_9LAMI|nr:hypothetical protein BUALT_Bualt07G0131700 [Buddleja alternifolia]
MNQFFGRRSSLSVRRLFGGVKKVNPSGNYRRFCGLTEKIEDLSWKSMEGVVKCPANYAPLSPISFLNRAAKVYRDRTSVVYGSVQFTWEQTRWRCVKMASALARLGISRGDVVATLAPNIPAMHELHFAVPMAGAVICTLNTRHDSAMISVLLQHSEAKIIFVDYQLLHIAQGAFDLLEEKNVKPPILVLIHENSTAPSPSDSISDTYEYETLMASGDSEFVAMKPKTEWDPISVNYTSGTTSRPKGVVYNHRGAYLNALATTSLHGMFSSPVYLWTVPMFHCNGWCLIWGLAALGGTNICLRHVSTKEIFDSIVVNNVTHMSGAPTVLNMIINSSNQKPLPHTVEIMTGGAPPPPSILERIEELGFRVSHLYGLTETYGPGTSCVWKPEWDSLPRDQRLRFKARQGVEHFGLEEVDVRDSVTMQSVPSDGVTIGEIMFRGNTVMSGYLKDVKATEEAFKVETVLYRHPAVLEAAVVARPDNHWGQTACAFVKLKEGFDVSAKEIIHFCKTHLPRYMAPRTVIFEDLPKTSTGKIQKFILREKAKALGSLF